MKIDISKLKDGESFDVEHSYDPKELNVVENDVLYASPLLLKGVVERFKDSILFRGELKAKVEMICARCLSAISKEIDETFDLFYPVKGGKTIDTTDEIRETVILSYPVKFLCREDCKGLCPVCGNNLNETKCKCKKG
ncbi:MAG: DUF177 domain-containing protein [Candidatus Omnitrophica bacterium]|nr:DUF177 domain-containing protein [Candidatus Omnitrophota bacterium]